jgi:hypothetical protein
MFPPSCFFLQHINFSRNEDIEDISKLWDLVETPALFAKITL